MGYTGIITHLLFVGVACYVLYRLEQRIKIIEEKEALRAVAVARLGRSSTSSHHPAEDEEEEDTSTAPGPQQVEPPPPPEEARLIEPSDFEDATPSVSKLKRLSLKDLTEMASTRGILCTDDEGKRLSKAQLVDKIVSSSLE